MPNHLRRNAHRLDRQNAAIAAVIEAMRRGATLQLQYVPSPQWRLSTGRMVPSEIARLVVSTGRAVGVGDALFDGSLSQTFRFVE